MAALVGVAAVILNLMDTQVRTPVDGWNHRVDDPVMVATPDHGSSIVYWDPHLSTTGPFGG